MISNRKTLFDLAVVIVVMMALMVPFINQAFKLDDQEFISFAEVKLEQPAQFYLEDVDQTGNHFDIFQTTHPPLLSSFIALMIWLNGGADEMVLHGAYLVFPLIAGISMYFLGRRFTGQPLFSSILFMGTVGYVVMSHTLMGDAPVTALWLASTATYVWGIDRASNRLLLLSGLLLSLTVMTAYQGLSLIPLLLLYAALKRRLGLMSILPLVAPILLFFLYAAYVYRSVAEMPRFTYSVGLKYGWQDLPAKGRALFAYIGGASIFPVALVIVLLGKKKKEVVILAAAVLTILVLWDLVPVMRGELTILQGALMAPMLAAGVLLLYRAGKYVVVFMVDLLKRRAFDADNVFLGVWILGVSFYVFVLLPVVTVRHLLPLFPALVLIFVRSAQDLVPRPRGSRSLLACSVIALGLAIAVPVAAADYRLAGTRRSIAAELAADYAAASEKPWFLGEFGFRYYMEKQGFRYLGVSAIAESGDLVIRSALDAGVEPLEIVLPPPEEYSLVVEVEDINDAFPVRTRSYWAEAGFYNHRMGPLPYTVSTEKIDELTTYRLNW